MEAPLLLAGIGIYGVVAQSVTERTLELGIRRAPGAPHRAIQKAIVKQALLPVAAGLTLGIMATLPLRGLLANLLFGIGSLDPATIVVATALLSAVSLVAAYVPARRATKLDPAAVLRTY